MTFKSNLGEAFRNQFAADIFAQKYRHESAYTWEELASTVVEDVCRENLSKDDKAELKYYICTMKFIPGGRYLYYAGRNKKYFNNCFVLISQEDSREDWALLSWKMERCLTVGGGVGNDYSIYRPRNSLLHSTGGQASGPISKMRMINEIGREVMQGGSRRSALYASLNWKHNDIYDFLKAKDWNNTNVQGTQYSLGYLKQNDFNFPCPLDMTNISSNYDTEWILKYWNTGDVGEVFKLNCLQALRTGEPGFSFNFFEKEKETGRNACVTGDTLILTKEYGYKPISQIVGAKINIWNGVEWSLVQPFGTGVNPILKVILSDGTEIRCTPYHKFILATGIRVCADELTIGDRLQKFSMPIDEIGKEYDIDAYSQGFYSGDGSEDYKRSNLYWTKFSCKNRLIGEFKSQNNEDRVTWIHGEMYPKFFVPINGSLSYRLNWLAGICDSDGTITRDKNGNGIQISSINKEFLLKIKLMLSRTGIRAKVIDGADSSFREMPDGRGGKKEYFCKKSFRLLIGNEDTYQLKQLGFKTERLIIHSDPPQRDARRFIVVKDIIDLKIQRKTYCVREKNVHNVTFEGVVTGNCTELTSSDTDDLCNLGSINLARINDMQELADVVSLSTKFLLCGTLIAELPYDAIYDVRTKNRRLGLGIMGYHEWLLQRGYIYSVPEELHRWLAIYAGVSRDSATKFSNNLSISNPVAVRSIAPTGSIGILASTTTGIEPVYAVAVKRRYLKGTTWKYQYVIDEIAKRFIDEYNIDPEKIESSTDLAKDYERRINVQANIQEHVDMAISSTINLPAWGSEYNNEDRVSEFTNVLAKYAHRLRGFTVYPDGARGGQPLVSVPYKEALDKIGVELEENTEHFDVCDITGTGHCGT